MTILKLSSGTRASSPVLLDIEDGDQADPPTVEEEVPSRSIVICLSAFLFSVNFSLILTFFSCSKQIVWNHSPRFNIAFVTNSISTCVVSTNFAGLGTTT